MFKDALQVIKASTLTLPSFEVSLFVVLLALCLLYRYNRAGIIVAYAFAARWGWLVVNQLPGAAQTTYIVLGILVGALAIVGMVSDQNY